MKSKKNHHDKENCRQEQPHSQRQPPNPKGRSLTKRPQEGKHNKENIVQITEPLDLNPQSFPSKEFVLSRESLGSGSRSALKDVGVNRNAMNSQKSIELKPYQKEQQIFDRRLSLKCTTGNYSQQLDYQKSQRLSMVPLRRDSAPIPQSSIDERESMSSLYQNSTISEVRSKQTIKKETIITNLMNKLDYEEDLRSIIELKLKNGSTMNSSQTFTKEKKNQSYMTDFTDENNQQSLVSKLKQCQSEISYFKTVIREMSEKIVELTEEKKFSRKKTCQFESRNTERGGFDHQISSLVKKTGNNCEKCSKRYKTSQIAVQTEGEVKNLHAMNESFDFLDNLEKTLKVLQR